MEWDRACWCDRNVKETFCCCCCFFEVKMGQERVVEIMNGKEITGEAALGENQGGANIKQPLLRYTCQGAVIVKAAPAAHCTLPDPRPVKCATLYQTEVFLCPTPWSQICQTSAIADHTTSDHMGLSRGASLDTTLRSCLLSECLICQEKLYNWLLFNRYVMPDLKHCLLTKQSKSQSNKWCGKLCVFGQWSLNRCHRFSPSFTRPLNPPPHQTPLSHPSSFLLPTFSNTNWAIDRKVIKYSWFETQISKAV